MNPIAEKKVLDHGLVALMRVDGSDEWPAHAARKSYRKNADEYSYEQNIALSDHLLRNKHTTPIEFNEATWMMVMPIFVARQFVRHRTASIDEESLRYVEARNEFYVPELDRMQKQSQTNKQGSAVECVAYPEKCQGKIDHSHRCAYQVYTELLQEGLAKELARSVLPLATYTGWMWKCDLHNTFHMLNLRLNPHAQYEIRVYAEAMHSILKGIFPGLVASWENHVLNAVTFSKDEQEVVARMIQDTGYPWQGWVEDKGGLVDNGWLDQFGITGRRAVEFQAKCEKVFGRG